jgi:alginate biosynthesis protein AlgK
MSSRRTMIGCAIAAAAAWVTLCHADATGYNSRVPKDASGLVINGASGPADLNRGKAAAAAGRVDDARRDLEPLAERGYVDAEIALGRLYINLNDTDHLKDGIHWLREAAKHEHDLVAVTLGRGLVREGSEASLDEGQPLLEEAWQRTKDPEALAGLIRLYSDHPPRDHQHQLPELAKLAEASNNPEARASLVYWYRRTPQIEDHQAKLLKICKRALDLVADCYIVLAEDARTRGDKETMQRLAAQMMSQYKAGRAPAQTTANLARALVATPDDETFAPVPVSDLPEVDSADLLGARLPGTSGPSGPAEKSCDADPLVPNKVQQGVQQAAAQGQAQQDAGEPELANQILERLVRGADEAPVMAAGVVVRYPYLVPDFEVEKALKSGVEKRQALAHLYLGELYLFGQRAMRDPKAALEHLQIAAKTTSTEVEAHYYLGRLYQFGYLDEVDGEKALQELLWAARRGYTRADTQIARLFSLGRGICPNFVNAYVFAKLGARDGTPAAIQLAKQLEGALSPKQHSLATAQYQREYALRPKEAYAEASETAVNNNNGVAP